MRFCTHCGAQVPDNSKFCTACGTPIDAPDEATVVISDPEEEVVEASDVEGEFTAASWSPEPAAKPQTQLQPQARRELQPEPVRPVQPVMKEAPKSGKKGFFSYVWLFLKVLIIAILAVMLAVFLRGVYIGYTSSAEEAGIPEQAPESRSVTKSTSKTAVEEDDGFQSLDDLSESERDEYTRALMERTENQSADKKSTMVQVGLVKFPLAGDYKIASREHMQNAEACIIVPKNATNKNNRLKVVIVPGEPQDVTGVTSEEIGYILKSNLGELVEELTSGKYDVHYEDNADGKYFPHCYCFLNLKKGNKLSYTYTQSTLVSGNVITGCAVATDEAELAALMDIYSAVVIGAFN